MNVREKVGGTCIPYLDADFLARSLVLGNSYRDPAVWRKDVCMLDLGKFKMLVTMHMGIFRETEMQGLGWDTNWASVACNG